MRCFIRACFCLLIVSACALADPALAVTFTVTNSNDAGPGSLREAVVSANIQAGADEIVFDPALAGGVIRLSSGEIAITDELEIVGLGGDQLSIDAEGSSRIFHVDDGSPASSMVVAISRLRLTGGSASVGGAILNRESLVLEETVINANEAMSAGGGIWSVADVDAEHVSLSLRQSELSENETTDDVGQGGGIYVAANDATTAAIELINSTVSTNVSTIGGGLAAIAAPDGSAVTTSLYNSTIAENVAYEAGGILHEGFGPSMLLLLSTIVGDNTADGYAGAIGDLFVFGSDSADHSLIEESNSIFGGTNQDGIDPQLGPLAFNGGPSRTHALLPSSPAIDAGSNALALALDQRGPGYARSHGSGADIGAFEVQGAIAVPQLTGPGLVALGTPVPNPGNGSATTVFPITLDRAAEVTLALFDVRGRKIATAKPVRLETGGEHAVSWRPGRLAAGVYLVQLITDSGARDSARWVVIR